jgi:hypothetical protein
VSVPCAGPVTTVAVSASLSASVSLARTLMFAAVSSAVLSVSFVATGASFRGVTVMLTVATPEST